MRTNHVATFLGRACLLAVIFSAAFYHHCQADIIPSVLGPGAPKDLRTSTDMDASGLDLSGSVFDHESFTDANFENCDLSGCVFDSTKFSRRVSFRNADLAGTKFTTCSGIGGLSENNFTGATINGMTFCEMLRIEYLSWEQIQSTKSYELKNLSGIQIAAGPKNGEPVNLYGFRMPRASFIGLDLSKWSFRGTYLYSASFTECKIKQEQIMSPYLPPGIRFVKMDLDGWDLSKETLRGMTFEKTDLRNVNIEGSTIRAITIKGGWGQTNILSKEQFYSTRSYRLGDLREIKLVALDLSGWDFSSQNLTDATFSSCNLTGADFTDAVITGASLNTCSKTMTLEQVMSTWNYKQGRMENVNLPDSIERAIREESSE